MTLHCRFCKAEVSQSFVNLGVSPLANSYVAPDKAHLAEKFYPLHAFVCGECFLVQLDVFESREEIFEDYAYLSSFSDSWLAHCKAYVDHMAERFELGPASTVVEIASNDGYLLQFAKEKGMQVLGIEPAKNVAEIANKKGIPTRAQFFGNETGKALKGEGVQADLMTANNVLAHVPDINDFVSGFQHVLKGEGVLTFEFPHLLTLIKENLFDTIYHEHFSYLSLQTVQAVLAAHGLRVFDVEELATHGGSLRVFACKKTAQHSETTHVAALLTREQDAGLRELSTYRRYSERVVKAKCDFLSFLIACKRDNCSVVGYGAPAKGNTLLNYCGVGPELIEFTVDRNPVKQGTFLPGSRIPVKGPEAISHRKPDYVVILPWNIREEIGEQLSDIRSWGGRFFTLLPRQEIF